MDKTKYEVRIGVPIRDRLTISVSTSFFYKSVPVEVYSDNNYTIIKDERIYVERRPLRQITIPDDDTYAKRDDGDFDIHFKAGVEEKDYRLIDTDELRWCGSLKLCREFRDNPKYHYYHVDLYPKNNVDICKSSISLENQSIKQTKYINLKYISTSIGVKYDLWYINSATTHWTDLGIGVKAAISGANRTTNFTYSLATGIDYKLSERLNLQTMLEFDKSNDKYDKGAILIGIGIAMNF